MSKYVEITKEEFERTLSELGKWEYDYNPLSKELIYILDNNIKIYSSIVGNISRCVGEDAIRVVVFDSIANLPVKSSWIRVYRINTWIKNIRECISKVKTDIQTMKKCKICGAFMVERVNSNTQDKFWGCLNYKNHNQKPEPSKAINTGIADNKVSLPIETHKSTINPQMVARVGDDTGNHNISTIIKSVVFEPSKYQLAIFDFIQNGTGHCVIKAGAGTAKTTSIVMGTKYIPNGRSVLYLAFNVHIKDEIAKRVSKSIDVRTFHSLGYMNIRNAWGNIEFNEHKQRNILWELVNADTSIQSDDKYDVVSVAHKICLLVKANLLDVTEDNILELVEYHGIELPIELPYIIEIVKMAINLSLKQKNVIDYSDEIYFPIMFNLKCKQYDFVFIDETQDCSKYMIELALRSVKPNGRIIAVGDENQSIMGFASADTTAIPSIIKRLNATILPLSVTYRCPASHVRLANKLVPELEARPNAPEGIIKCIDYNEFFNIVKPGDMVICRNNAPLVRPAFALLGRGIKVAIKGRDIGENLINVVKKFKTPDIDVFFDRLNTWHNAEVNRCKKKRISPAMVEDKYEVLNILSEDCKDVQCIINKIKTIFSDENMAITFSSVHRFKGLEGNTIHILEPSLMPSKHAEQPWQIIEEDHIKYVAITRSKDTMYFVSESGDEGLFMSDENENDE